jgi:1-pyrroline-5-carboxylate dehydrogenase
MKSVCIDIPLIINGREIRTGQTGTCTIPHNHAHVLATYHMAGPEEVRMAVDAAVSAQKEWAALSWEHRLAIFLKAAELIKGPWRDTLNAATMLGQSKTVYEADADSACELMDFFRYNAWFVRQIIEEQPGC